MWMSFLDLLAPKQVVHHGMKSHKVSPASVHAAQMPLVTECSLGDPDCHLDEGGGKAMLSLLSLSSFLFPMLKWLKLG